MDKEALFVKTLMIQYEYIYICVCVWEIVKVNSITFIIAIITLVVLDGVDEDGCDVHTYSQDSTRQEQTRIVTKGPQAGFWNKTKIWLLVKLKENVIPPKRILLVTNICLQSTFVCYFAFDQD